MIYRRKKTQNFRNNFVNFNDTFINTFTPLSHLCVFFLRVKSSSRECLLERNSELNLKEACS